MADNINVDDSDSNVKSIAADEINGVLHQRVKITIGGDGVNDGDASSSNPLPVSVIDNVLPTNAATESTVSGLLADGNFTNLTGAINETAPATDTASSGLNGRLQRIAQRLTSIFTTLTDGSSRVQIQPDTTNNSLTSYKLVCAATTNATSIKASAGRVYMCEVFNSDTVGYWVKFYNKASAPTVGTDVPVATRYAPPGGGFVMETALGIPYTTGIAIATTLNATDSDATAVTTANKLLINMRYA